MKTILWGCVHSSPFPFPVLVILTDKLIISGLDQTFFDFSCSVSVFISPQK